ncbi:MerR family transcriptional regulator [Jiangella anatolica]|uniref:MerR family transcriptional regulator n=1 Tax=Jiangella anatolica TaxID=2670374 RepID=A0A2W2C1X9_9ACTN|nr:MerR family transcriptional regulator [Jiangella anatolica]PZF82189.1 MerR family transcriptional regulator [Jiangella anatolica]
MSAATESLPIGAVAARFGLAVSTLRYWEERGLLRAAERRAGRRRHGPDEVHRIALIQLWRETGLMSLDDIGAVLTGGASWRDVVEHRVAAIEQQLTRLGAAKAHLEHLLTCPSAHPADDCPYLRAEAESRYA